MQTTRLPSIRDLVALLARRPGVEAALLAGRDGLVIDGHAAPGVGLDEVAAHVPALISAAEDLSSTAARGLLFSQVLEFERGFAVIATLGAEAVLVVLATPASDVGAIASDIRRHRRNIASIL